MKVLTRERPGERRNCSEGTGCFQRLRLLIYKERALASANDSCGFVFEDVGERFIDQFRAQECGGVVVFEIGILDEVHADDAAFFGQFSYQFEGFVPAETAGFGRSGGRDDARVEAVDVDG